MFGVFTPKRPCSYALRFGSQVNLKAAKIKTMLRVYDRIADVQGAELIIASLDDRFGSQHCFNNLMTLELLTAKTALPKNVPLQRALLLWTLEPLG